MTAISDIAAAFVRLLPQGGVWPKINDYDTNNFIKLIAGSCDEFQRLSDAINDNILDAVFPDATGNYISDWERVLGLPFTPLAQGDAQRAKCVVAMFGLSKLNNSQFFIDLASLIGFSITITEGEVTEYFRASENSAGDALTTGSSQFSFTIHVWAKPEAESLDTLKELIKRFKPKHIRALYVDHT